MAAAQGRLSDDADGTDDAKEGDLYGTGSAPTAFRAAVDALRTARLRPQVEVEAVRAPQRLAPFAYALEATVADGEQELADGRLVLLHDPAEAKRLGDGARHTALERFSIERFARDWDEALRAVAA